MNIVGNANPDLVLAVPASTGLRHIDIIAWAIDYKHGAYQRPVVEPVTVEPVHHNNWVVYNLKTDDWHAREEFGNGEPGAVQYINSLPDPGLGND